MNRLMNVIAIVTALSIVQGCTQLAEQKGKVTMTENHSNIAHAEETSRDHPKTHTSTTHGETHATHKDDHANPASAQAKLTTSRVIEPNIPTLLEIDIQDTNRNVITQFDRFQEQVMHLIAVSDDLQVFQHLHPTYKGNGKFEVEAQFPQSGSYTFFSDYQPTGQAEQVSVLKTQVNGYKAPVAQIDWNHTKTFEQTTVDFAPSQATIKAGEDVILQFDLKDKTSNQPLTDLQPYLGEKGHLVILRQSAALTREDYIHAHAVHDTPANQVHFATRFPQPGRYKLWGQFNRNSKIITADFWVEVVQ